MFFSHIVAGSSALLRSLEYAHAIGIKRGEWKRYLKKSLSLGLCYAGFSVHGRVREAWRAGEAAFLCCAYDVVTDWRNFNPEARKAYEAVFRSMKLKPELKTIAIDLYEKEISGRLEEDGLDRGYIALRFILKMMDCEKDREVIWGDINEVGRLLQIVDDVLDYEQDIERGEMNCLTSDGRNVYLRKLISDFNPVKTKRLFGSGRSALVIAIERAREKAIDMISVNDSGEEHIRHDPVAGIASQLSSPR